MGLAEGAEVRQQQQGHRLPCEALVQLLQSLVVLRVRPPQPLLHALLVLLSRDMVLEKGPVLVALLVVLAQLGFKPCSSWLRALLLRLQVRLRLLSFDQLTQVGRGGGGYLFALMKGICSMFQAYATREYPTRSRGSVGVEGSRGVSQLILIRLLNT